MTCVAQTGFASVQPVCGRPAVVLVTVENAGPFVCTREPYCAACARIVERIVEKYYRPAGSFVAVPLAGAA